MIDSPVLLLVVLAVIAATPLLLRRHKAAQPDGLRVVSRTALSRTATVAVLAVGERRLLVGAGERGVHLLAEVTDAVGLPPNDDASHVTFTTTEQERELPPFRSFDRTDAVGAPSSPAADDQPLAGLVERAPLENSTAGPRIGLLDRLRVMTVRTPVQGRPFHVPLRR